MKKAIAVLQNRMSEYKQIGSDKAMEYYWSCNRAVNELQKLQEAQANGANARTKPALPIQSVVCSAYLVVVEGKGQIVVNAENIANAMDKLESAGYSKYEFVHSKSFDVI